MTDEFFVAVKEFNLSWDSEAAEPQFLQYAFVDQDTKAELLETYNSLKKFEEKLNSHGIDALKNVHSQRGFICSRYRLWSKIIAR